MYSISLTIEVILRQQKKFLKKNIIISGKFNNYFPFIINAKNVVIQTYWFEQYIYLINKMNKNSVFFGIKLNNDVIKLCTTIVYFWPKNKSEAIFQLINLLSYMKIGNDIFIVGNNNSGVCSAKKLLQPWCMIKKIDNARKCSLFFGKIHTIPLFNSNDFVKIYSFKEYKIYTLPGVFGYKKIDKGSELLISTFCNYSYINKVLDVGCGSGILSLLLSKYITNINITLIDAHYLSLISSKKTLQLNNIKGNIIAGDIYSTITEKFDMIISNPPLHNGIKVNLTKLEKIIRYAPNYLNLGGKLVVVIKSSLNYLNFINKIFNNSIVISQNKNFKVYQAIKMF